MSAYVEVTFHPEEPDKTMELKVVGIKGKSCHDAARPYEQVLGGEIISTTPTSEARELPVREKAKQRGL